MSEDPVDLIEKAFQAAPILTIVLTFIFALMKISHAHDKHVQELISSSKG